MSFPREGLPASLTHLCYCAIRRLWLQLFFVLLPIVPQMMVLIGFSWWRIWLPCSLEYSLCCFHNQWWTTLGFVAKKPCGGWLDDAWSSNPPKFGFWVSSKNDIGPVLCGDGTNGIACPRPSMPWEEFCWWVVCEQSSCWFGWRCEFVDVPFSWVCLAWRLLFWHWWTMRQVCLLQPMTSLLLFSAKYWVPLHCWLGCPPCLPWACGHQLCCKPWVQIGTMHCCVLRVSYCSLGMWQLRLLVFAA